MSSPASAGAGTPSDFPDEYDEMLDVLDDAIAEAHRKVENGRVYDAENEKVRVKQIRALAYAMNVKRQIVNDRKRGEIEERLERLEESTD